MRSGGALLALLGACSAHDDGLPVNPLLGVPGFPSCIRPKHLGAPRDVESAAAELECFQERQDADVLIGTIGDSITAGVHSSGGNHTYPGQLQIMLDEAHGKGKYGVTNLGACGSTMLKKSNSPYWQRGQYKTLTSNKWDIIVIMLGTNDAKDPGDHGPNNWLHNCGGPDHTTINGCSFAEDWKSMVQVVSGLGRNGKAPKIYGMIPPPLMAQYSIGANQTVINSVYPKLIPLITADAHKTYSTLEVTPIDVYTGMGGVTNWNGTFPKSCTLDTAKTFKPCAWWCDQQSCDQCHPNNDGYTQMASIVKKGLGL